MAKLYRQISYFSVCLLGLPALSTAGPRGRTLAHALALPGQTRVAIEPRPVVPQHRRPDLRVDANLVLVPVSVVDSQNQPVAGLSASTFRVFDDGKEQSISRFAMEDMPISMGIVFDSSASMVTKVEYAKRGVAELMGASNPDDEFFLVQVSDRARVSVPWTSSSGEIQNQLLFTQPHGRTPLLDGVYLALQYATRSYGKRRAVVIISDGGDNESRYTQSELRELIKESDVWIYSIGIYSSINPILPEEERGGPSLLTHLAEDSGGRQLAITTGEELVQAAATIGHELRNEYVLGFSPERNVRDGKYHRLEVKLRTTRHLSLSFKRGYYAPE